MAATASGAAAWRCSLRSALLAVAGSWVIAFAAHAEPRFALVVGNGGYATAPLPNAVNDANAVKTTNRNTVI